MTKRIFSYGCLLAVILLSYWSISSLFIPGFFPMHDDTQVARVYEMAKSLSDGMFPVRWVSDLGYGYGYPIFTFYGPFAYYLGAGFVLFGLPSLLATKFIFITGIVLSGVGMYYLAKTFWGQLAAVVAAMLYVYAPYHAVNIYVRGAVGELFGYAFLPFLFFGLIKLFEEKKPQYFLISSLSLAFLIASHNLTALMVAPFLFLFLFVMSCVAIKRKSKHKMVLLFLSVVLGILISTFYWLPALSEMNYTNVASQVGKSADFRDHFVCPQQLWESAWGFGGSAKGCIDGLSFRLGKIHIILSILSLSLLYMLWKDKRRVSAVFISIFFLLLSVFLSLPYSEPLWNSLKPFAYVQYPWRLLVFMSFFSSFLGGGVVWFVLQKISIKKKWQRLSWIVVVVCIAGIIVFYAKLFTPQTIIPVASGAYTDVQKIRWETSRISDEYMPKNFVKPISKTDIPSASFSVLDGESRFSNETKKTQHVSVTVISSIPSRILARIAYFPAWRGFIDGKETQYQVMTNGLAISVPEGRHTVEFRYISTQIEFLANLLSLVGIVGLATGIIVLGRRRLHYE